MRRAGDIALLVVQWALVLAGLYLLSDGSAAAIAFGDYFVVPVYQRLVQALVHGLGALGLGAGLFYLRRLSFGRQ